MVKQVHRVERHSGGRGAKIAATAIIWPCAVVMLALCIPIVKVVKSEFVPLAIILGASGSTALVWFSPAISSGKQENDWDGSSEIIDPQQTTLVKTVASEAINSHHWSKVSESNQESITPILPLW
ncbi:hypothetical protein PN466_19850 [Roseofilum reptotaenium CS-1145]|uniref:Uncharacterized protein n=1 Tax=Roseofilum reptotaenium AO1-A TaxID=1925591 RepID=A0A1L9QX70_9CYAN|nr:MULTISPECIES: hypothetical protein [Roseofilum]MBP0027873.1 hypothetical protein [Roseofilum sp. Guam]MDB9519203.1 hypothetical protein [Roseofilum reptotaenium CS-1145]OJJ27291.1 hypothetical protein BI308_02060 [Roseofilum reptotaenium AO1-A]